MKKTIIVLSAIGAATMAAPAAAKDIGYFCWVSEYRTTGGVNGGGRYLHHLSSRFAAPEGQYETIAAAFLDAVKRRTPDLGTVRENRCTWSEDRADLDRSYEYRRTTYQKQQLIEVDWTYR
ncbi:hypothetical protein AAG614_15275 [Citromicrobium bathyomarinum]